MTLTSPTGTSTTTVTIDADGHPGIFSLFGTGARDGAILHAVTFALGAFSVTTGGAPTFLAIFATGVNVANKPTVRIGGVEVPVQFAGAAPCCVGLQQINVQLVDALQGAGRVEVELDSDGRRSNVVEVVILPNAGQGPFASDTENHTRSREVATIASVPNTSLALVADENDDVVRVIDVKQKKVIRTITLPEGAEPVAIAVTADGTTAVVAERNRGKVAIVNLTTNTVTREIAAGSGPTSVAINGAMALVVNQDSNSVSVIDLAGLAPLGAPIAVGRGPRAIGIDAGTSRAFVSNQNSGTISVIDIGTRTVANTFNLGANFRPAAIQVIPASVLPPGFAIVAEPSASPDGKVLIVNLANGTTAATVNVNPDRSGGASDIAIFGSTVFFANQAGGSITVAPVSLSATGVNFATTTVKVGLGARALAIDTKDNLLLVSNEGSGNIALIDLSTNQIVGRIDAVRSEHSNGEDEDDDHDDRNGAANMPVIASLSPASGKAGTTFTLTINGTSLTGATDVIFVESRERGDGGGHGSMGDRDAGFTASNIQVNAAGTQLTAQIQIAAGHAAGSRAVRVLTPNGESTGMASPANTFAITP